jgi:PadR family transcriptional regulator, regulatory protein AphA
MSRVTCAILPIMSLRYALIGLLAWRPSSGYELTKRFALSMGHVWPVSHSQIYPELARLAADGLIEQTEEGPRGRKTYAATPSGVAALREWMQSTEPDYGRRSEADLREFFLWVIPPADALAYLERSANVYRTRLADLESIARLVDWTSDTPNRATRLTVEKGLRKYRMLIDWANWATEEIKAGALEPSGPTPGEHDRGAGASVVDGKDPGQSRTEKQRSSATSRR